MGWKASGTYLSNLSWSKGEMIPGTRPSWDVVSVSFEPISITASPLYLIELIITSIEVCNGGGNQGGPVKDGRYQAVLVGGVGAATHDPQAAEGRDVVGG